MKISEQKAQQIIDFFQVEFKKSSEGIKNEMKNKNGYPIKEYRNFLVPPNIVAGMTGVVSSWQNPDGSLTLLYSDQTEQSTPKNQQLIEDFADFFSLVSHVQEVGK